MEWRQPTPARPGLHLLARIKGLEKKYIGAALKDANPDIRITGLRIARERGFDVIPLVKQLVSDKDPAVRRECAIALRHNDSPATPALWAKLAQHTTAGSLVPRGAWPRTGPPAGQVFWCLARSSRQQLGHAGRPRHRLALALQQDSRPLGKKPTQKKTAEEEKPR
ncbi:MAG: hypothetical protein Ct9H300mP32_3400 [Verrucomicrobiota bacterium]|nr:MAG: hypothetical protein Ct9H300mP32_3400 [Verrucomicrobiota bacterium]